MLNPVKEYLSDFVSLFYPRLCSACGNGLRKGEEVICYTCLYQLPLSHYEQQPDNSMERHFWGRVQLERAAALYLFQKGGKVQHLVHQLKYKGYTDTGIKLGKIFGQLLTDSGNFNGIDLILPVPLHYSRERVRGYNQSDFFAKGLSHQMAVPWQRDLLIRASNRESQTKKSRFERWKNVESIFALTDKEAIANKHILLVDDVMTTGATLEACTRVLQQGENVKVSIATIGCAVI